MFVVNNYNTPFNVSLSGVDRIRDTREQSEHIRYIQTHCPRHPVQIVRIIIWLPRNYPVQLSNSLQGILTHKIPSRNVQVACIVQF